MCLTFYRQQKFLCINVNFTLTVFWNLFKQNLLLRILQSPELSARWHHWYSVVNGSFCMEEWGFLRINHFWFRIKCSFKNKYNVQCNENEETWAKYSLKLCILDKKRTVCHYRLSVVQSTCSLRSLNGHLPQSIQ